MTDPWSEIRSRVHGYDAGAGFYLRVYAPGAAYPGMPGLVEDYCLTCDGVYVWNKSLADAPDLAAAKAEALRRVRRTLEEMLASIPKEP